MADDARVTLAAQGPAFAYVTPLRDREYVDLIGCAMRPAAGWALVDATGRACGYHRYDPTDVAWCDRDRAFDSFVTDPDVRSRLRNNGFHVDLDVTGSLLIPYLNTNPRAGDPPLAELPAHRPPEPIYSDWDEMLELGTCAVTTNNVAPGQFLEPFLKALKPGYRRPAVFTPPVMRTWLDADTAAACRAIRIAGGWLRMPDTHGEAIELLNPLGCRQYGRNHWIKAAHAKVIEGDGSEWRVASCSDCSHPFLDYYHRPRAAQSFWSFYEDLQ